MPYSYRIKGFVNLDDERTVIVNVTQDDITIKDYSNKISDKSKLVIFAKDIEKIEAITKRNQLISLGDN